jgi:hypothetical protein
VLGTTGQYLSGNGTWQALPVVPTNPLSAKLLSTSATGGIIPFALGTSATQYLNGLGQWQTLPVAPVSPWVTVGNDVYKPTGNVGIGTQPSPFYKLDVIGDARISNNLYVGGGLIITDRVNATTEVQGGDFIVNNQLNVTGVATFNGSSTFNGANVINGTSNYLGASNYNAPATFNQTAKFNNKVKAIQGIEFESTVSSAGIKYTAANTNNSSTISYGRVPVQYINNCITSPTAAINHQFGGYFQLFNPVNGSAVVGDGFINMQTGTQGGSSIDGSTVSSNGTGTVGGKLLINYFCGSNTYLNTGPNGGTVGMGNNVEIGQPFPAQPNCALNIKGADDYTGLYLVTNHSSPYGYNTKLEVNNTTVKAFAVGNNIPTIAQDVFTIYGDGQTIIGKQQKPTSSHNDAMLSVKGKIVSTVSVVSLSSWADYVFDTDYKLPNLYDTEVYYKANHHLPEIPSECEVLEQGIDVGEMNKLLLKKIEEMTLLMVQQQKQIDAINAKIK